MKSNQSIRAQIWALLQGSFVVVAVSAILGPKQFHPLWHSPSDVDKQSIRALSSRLSSCLNLQGKCLQWRLSFANFYIKQYLYVLISTGRLSF